MTFPDPHLDSADGSLSDEALIVRMASRDEDALRELHRRHARLLYALGQRMLRQSDDVDCCVQDAFVNAWNHAARFDPSRARARTWLVSIAHHRFLQQLRDRPDPALELEDWDQPTRDPDPADRLMAERAMTSLDGTQRELIELAYFRGYSHSELSAITGLPLGTVKSRMRAALDRMRTTLSPPRLEKGGETP
ncbi:RNA polymerase sigma factor [Deinococcus hohokamensis]|uniref:RNA polymerase sigma factor n=1 Tax=Deinococcus hohokamensis TaxID=309883 RepID=A0ABV9IBE6_9DEIO